MKRCSAITQAGQRCRQTIVLDDGLCTRHSPRRKEAAPRPGSSWKGPAADFQAAPLVAARYRVRLERIADDVLDPASPIGSKSAAVAVSALNACLRALTVQAALQEHEQLEPRLRAIEEAQRWAG